MMFKIIIFSRFFALQLSHHKRYLDFFKNKIDALVLIIAMDFDSSVQPVGLKMCFLQ